VAGEVAVGQRVVGRAIGLREPLLRKQLQRALAGVPRQARAAVGRLQERDDRFRHRRRIRRRHQHRRLADGFGDSSDIGRDDRCFREHRIDERTREGIGDRRQREDVRALPLRLPSRFLEGDGFLQPETVNKVAALL